MSDHPTSAPTGEPDAATWDPDALNKRLGGWFAGRDPSVGFAADSVMSLS